MCYSDKPIKQVNIFKYTARNISCLSVFKDTKVKVPVTVAEHCLRSLGTRDRAFKSHSGHGCLVFVYVCGFFCVCVQVEALWLADHSPKESYRMSKI
jgi:hypothetical protein